MQSSSKQRLLSVISDGHVSLEEEQEGEVKEEKSANTVPATLLNCPTDLMLAIQSYWDSTSLACMYRVNKHISSTTRVISQRLLKVRVRNYWTDMVDAPDKPPLISYSEMYPILYAPLPLIHNPRQAQYVPASVLMYVCEPDWEAVEITAETTGVFASAPTLYLILDSPPHPAWYSAIRQAKQETMIFEIHLGSSLDASSDWIQFSTGFKYPLYSISTMWLALSLTTSVTNLTICGP
jgi:hypothetical protein